MNKKLNNLKGSYIAIIEEIKKENIIKDINIECYGNDVFFNSECIKVHLENNKKIYIGYNVKIDSYVLQGVYNSRCIELSQYIKLDNMIKSINTMISNYDNIYNHTVNKINKR
jgi:hypothetical protein